MTFTNQLIARKLEIEAELLQGRIQRNALEYAAIVQALGGNSSSDSGVTQSEVEAAVAAAINGTIDSDVANSLTRLVEIAGKLPALSGGKIPVEGGTSQATLEAAINATIDVAVEAIAVSNSAINAKLPALSANRLPITDGWRYRSLSPASTEYSTGANFIRWTVPANREWQFQSAYITITTDATATPRNLRFSLSLADGGWGAINPSRVDQTASQVRYYMCGLYPSLDAAIATSFIYISVPPVILGAGEAFYVQVNNRQAGDVFNEPRLLIMERTI